MNKRVSLARPLPPSNAAPPLLNTNGAHVILGARDTAAIASPIAPSAGTLFGPRGAVLASPRGPLFVCDTGHHRLLGWHSAPERDNAPADIVIGQPDFHREGRNANATPGAATLNVPTGIAFGGGWLAVADAWNHRVLLWRGAPQRPHRPADIVLGQSDFVSTEANRGADAPTAATLHWPYGVAIIDGRLFVADTGNRRVLIWNRIPESSGVAADIVLGQHDFTTRDENAGSDTSALGMRWPHGIAVLDSTLFVADAGNNRVMAWREIPCANGAPCDFVLGQESMAAAEHNRGAYTPSAAALNMPYGLGQFGNQLIVADTANSRLLGFDRAALAMDAPATTLAGQHSFADKGDNRWHWVTRDSLCWPYGVAACGTTLVIADSGNNRVLLWPAI